MILAVGCTVAVNEMLGFNGAFESYPSASFQSGSTPKQVNLQEGGVKILYIVLYINAPSSDLFFFILCLGQ